MSITLLLAAVLAAAPAPAAPANAPVADAPVDFDDPSPVAEPSASGPVPAAVAAADGFVKDVAIACPAGATRTLFPLVPNTLVELETLDAVSSKTSHPGDKFDLRVREPLRYGAVELIPAGAMVHGDVVHAGKSKLGGQAGELNLAARYVQLPQGRLRLHGSFGSSGKSHAVGATVTVVLFGIAGMAVHGANATLGVGSPLSARLADAVTFHCDGLAPPPSATDPSSDPTH